MQSTVALMPLAAVGIHLLKSAWYQVAPKAGILQSPLQRGGRQGAPPGGRPAVHAATVHDMLINLGSLGVEGPQLIWR